MFSLWSVRVVFSDMNSVLTEVLLRACISPVLLGDKFAMEHMMLVALLHNHVGSDVGQHVMIMVVSSSFLPSLPPSFPPSLSLSPCFRCVLHPSSG